MIIYEIQKNAMWEFKSRINIVTTIQFNESGKLLDIREI